MNRHLNRNKLLGLLDAIRRPGRPIESITDNDSLVGSGLIDSLAILDIILFLETEFSIDFTNDGIDPTTLDSIDNILDLIDRQPVKLRQKR